MNVRSSRVLRAAKHGSRAVVLVAALLACSSSGGSPATPVDTGTPSARDSVLSIVSGGRTRTFVWHVPPSYRPGTPASLLLVFHGAGGTGRDMAYLTGLSEWSDRLAFLVAYPDGVAETQRGWALGCARCTYADAAGIDDYALVRDLVESLARRYTIDRQRVFATGFSLGGSFAYDLACHEPDLLAGTAVVSSLPSPEELAICRPATRPLRVLTAIGDRDPNLPWIGGVGAGGVTYQSAVVTAGDWAARNQCVGPVTKRSLPDRDADGFVVEVTEYVECPSASLVRFFKIQGLGHAWPRSADLDMSETIARTFFSP